jgi:thiol-disulfide isomerase/thioredoxin
MGNQKMAEYGSVKQVCRFVFTQRIGQQNMQIVYSKTVTVVGLSLAALLLASCAAPADTADPSEPATQITQNPAPTGGTTGAAGDYIPYASYNSSVEEYADSKVVLFFYADWCATCKKARENFEASLGQIPEDLTIVVVDFNTEIDLRKKYGVTVQHTFIEIDNDGEALGKWSGSFTVAEIVEQLS